MQKHNHNIELLFYCETCEQLICRHCRVEEHNGHNHDTVENMTTKLRSEMNEVTPSIDEMIRGLCEAHDNIDRMKKKVK